MHSVKVTSSLLFLDLTADCSMGDNLSDSSEGRLQRGKGGARVYELFAGKNMQSSIESLLLITKNRHLKLMILVLFCVWEEDGKTGII